MILLDGKTIGNQGRVTYSSIVYLCFFVMLTFVFSFTSSFFSPSSASAINSSITLNLSTSTLSLDLTPKLGGGFAKSGNNTINVKTNHYTGYTLKITAGTNDTNSTKLVNIESNTTIDSIESNVSEADFSANTDAAATSYNGKWGFMPSQYVTTDNTNPSSPIHTIVDNDPTGSNASNAVYLPAPDYATGTTLDITSSANPDTFNTYTISLGARAGMETTAGTYSNTFNILAIGNPIIYSITFSDNTGDSSVTNLPTGTGSVSTSDIDILLPTTIPTRTGYDFIGWCKTETTTNGTVCPSNTPYPASVPAVGQTPAVPSYYEIDQTTDNTELTFYATWAPKTYTLNLDVNGGTSGSGSTTTTATYDATTLSTITNPTRANGTATRTVSGFTKSTSASDATISSTTTLNSNATITYTFNGWRETSAANSTLIATNATTPVLQANTTYTNSTGAWNYDNSGSNTTLYAGWDSTIGSYSSVTLPTITKTGYNCHWNTNSSDTGTSYSSGASIVPNTDITLTAFCTPKTYELTLNANGGTLGSTKTTATYDSTTLSTITNPTKANDTGTRTISGLAANGTNASGATITFQSTGNCIAANNCKSTNTTTYAFNGWYKETGQTNKIASNATTPALQANTSYTNASGAWTNDGAVTLYAGWTTDVGSYAQVTLPTITKTGYTCGWDTSSTATDPTYSSGASMTPGGNITLYGICKANTYTINLDGNNATTSGSTSTTATYDSTTLSSITNPSRQYTVSGFDNINNGASGATITYQSTGNCTSSSNCKSTYTFNGWYKESGATNKIASNATTPVLEASTSYTDANGKWTSTSTQTLFAGWSSQAIILPTITKPGHTCGWTETSSGATTITYQSGSSLTPAKNYTLHGICKANTYTITLNANGGTGGSSSTSVTYGATTLGTITNPTKANTTGTRTISGFTMTTAGTNASITWPSSGCTSSSNCKSTNTTTYSFNGWYKESGTTNKIASSATTPVLSASTSYTDANGKWTSTSGQTLYAGYIASTGNYSSVTLPTITRTGSTCGWATTSTATSWNYDSGASLVPDGNITLYGVCKNSITLDRNGGTGGSDSATATYGATTLTNITNPTKASTTGTRTISGLAANGTNASGATVTFQSSGNCTSTSNCKSSNTTTYTFNGWHQGSATGTVVTNGGSPANLQPSTNYTNASSQWTYTTASAVTLYAGWNSSAGSYASVTLPTITKTGYTCGWDTSSTATDPTYSSGSSMTPGGNITLYGICKANTYSLAINFAGTGVSSVQVRTASGTGGTLMGTVSTSGGSVSNLVYNTAYYLYPVFSSGYEFSGWAKTSGSGTISSTTASNPTFTIGAGNGTVTVTGKEYCAGKVKMQSLTTSSIATLLPNEHSTATVCDIRDNQTYTVAKLKDGKYWMTENLNLAGGTALSADDTDVTSAYISSFSTSNNLTKSGNTIVLPASATTGFNENNYSYVYNSGNTTNCGASGQNTPCYSYYSWDAATLGSGRTLNTENTDAPYSICPKGWRLPTSGNSSNNEWKRGDFYALATAYGANLESDYYETSAIFYNNAGPGTVPGFLLAGYYSNGSFRNGGSYGAYWSSTSASGTSYARRLYFNSSSVNSASSNSRYLGFSVRCIFESRTISDVTYLQDVTPSIVNNTTIGTTISLKDKRDEQSYTVGKLADGKLWMLDNLALDLANSTVLDAMSASNTNAGSVALGYLKNGGGTASNKYAIVGVSNWTSGHSNPGPLVNLTYKDVIPTDAISTAGGYKVGGYYNYCAASAGSYCYGNGIDYGTSYGNATEDICPKGWRMPTGGTSGDYSALANAVYGSTGYSYNATDYANYRSALHLPLSGGVFDGPSEDLGSQGGFWSSTRYSDQLMHQLNLSDDSVNPASNNFRNIGLSVRCLFGPQS